MQSTLSRSARGFTLIEVLITIFVVAIGLLAAAGMQAASKKAAFDAIQRSNATALAQEIIERMRTNSAQLNNYVRLGGAVYQTPPPAAQPCTIDKVCTALEMVSHDLSAWWDGLNGSAEAGVATATSAGGLRRPTGCIQFPSDGKNQCRVTVAIAWRGLTPLEDSFGSLPADSPLRNRCGTATEQAGFYDDADQGGAADDTRYRRVLVINTNLDQGGVCP